MKKVYVLIIALVCTAALVAQDKVEKTIEKKVEKTIEKKGDLTIATYYYENGQVMQTGPYNQSGTLDGKWVSYDIKGHKSAVGYYENGIKVGKWFFWTDNTLKEVDFKSNEIAVVKEWSNSSIVALRN